MGIRRKDFQIPETITVEKRTLTSSYGKFVIEPLERGFGTTLGNSLRRMLLSSIQGVAVIALIIDGVDHEFSCVEGLLEDVPQIIMNIRKLVLTMKGDEKRVITLDVSEEGVVKAEKIKTDGFVEVVDKDQYLFTLTKPKKISMEFTVVRGRGFSTAQENKGEGFPIGVIPIDSFFSPIVRVNFSVEDKRVVDITDYNKLILEIQTNGSVHPRDALNEAALIWKKHLDLFQEANEIESDFVEIESEEEEKEEESFIQDYLNKDISELELSVRSSNCLRKAGIQKIQDLVVRSEEEILKYPNFGMRSLEELKKILSSMNLSLNMNLDEKKGE